MEASLFEGSLYGCLSLQSTEVEIHVILQAVALVVMQ